MSDRHVNKMLWFIVYTRVFIQQLTIQNVLQKFKQPKTLVVHCVEKCVEGLFYEILWLVKKNLKNMSELFNFIESSDSFKPQKRTATCNQNYKAIFHKKLKTFRL